MATEEVQARCSVEQLNPADLLDAIRTLNGRNAEGVLLKAPGEGVDTLLQWALSDLRLATNCADPVEQKRHATNAVMNARRALSCLVDWYLRRDGFESCKNAPRRADEKASIILRRGIIDDLTSRVLARAIRIRDVAEHEFQAVSLEDAEDLVELLRRTIQCIRTHSSPEMGPFIFGFIGGGTSYSEERGYRGMFYGWSDPVAVINTFASEPWIGVVIPNSRSDAVLRKVILHEIDSDLLLNALTLLESIFGTASGGSGARGCVARAAAAGLG